MKTSPVDFEARANFSLALHLAYVEVVGRLGPTHSVRQAVAHDAMLLAMEHHAAIATLVRFRHFATSHALIRALMETTFRALWVLYLCDFESLQRFIEGRSKPDLDDMARMLAKRGPQELKGLGSAILDQRHVFHSFAHAGLEQLVRRRNGFMQEEVRYCLLLADTFGVLAGEVGAVVHKSLALRELTAMHARPLAIEAASYSNSVPPPPPEWTGALPEPPVWQDLE
jgi:hypothetical protein